MSVKVDRCAKFNCTFTESASLAAAFDESPTAFNTEMGEVIKGLDGKDGKDGVTFIPELSDEGVLSWTNDGDLENPDPFNLGNAGIGKSVTGNIYAPYVVDEANNYLYIYEDEQEALAGAEIYNDYENNIAIGLWSHAEGYQTQAIGNYSRASGWWTRADGQCAVAEGLLTRASGHFSHAEGTRTIASINNAHAEGDLTQATGRQSHAEGVQTIASGYCAHAEGANTQATNYYSHAEGLGTIAAGRNQTAMGKYNIRDTTSLLIVGNGTKDTDRKNAFKLDASGNGTFSGKVTANGTPTADNDLVTIKYLKDNLAALVSELLAAEN